MNLGFNWNAVPQWIWYLMIGTLGALIMLAIDIFVLGRWRRGQTSKKITEYEAQIAALSNERESLNATLGQAQTEARQRLELVSARDKEGADLKAQIGNLRAELDAGAKSRMSFQSDVQTKDGLIADLKAQMGRLQAELAAEKGKGGNLAAEIGKLGAAAGAGAALSKSLEADKAKLQADLDAAHKARIALDAELSGLKGELPRLKADLEGSRAEAASLRVDLEKKAALQSSAAQDIAKFSASAASSAALATSLEGERNQLQADLKAALAARAAAEAEASAHKTNFDAQLAEFQVARRNAVALDGAVKAKDAEAGDLQAKLSALLKERAALEAGLLGRDNELGELKVKLGGLQADLDKANAARSSVAADVVKFSAGAALAATLQSESADLKAKHAAVQADLDATARAKIDLEARLNAAVAELGGLRAKLDAATAATARMAPVEEIAGFNARIASLESELAAAKAARADAEAQSQIFAADAGMWRTMEQERASQLEADAVTRAGFLGEFDEKNAQLGTAQADAGMWRTRFEETNAVAADLEAAGNEASGRFLIAQADAGMWRVRAEELESEKATLEEAGNETSGQFQIARADAGMWRVRAEELESEKATLEEAGNETSGQFQIARADAGMWRVRAEELESEKANLEESGNETSGQFQIARADAGMWRVRAEELESEKASVTETADEASARLHIAAADAGMWRTRAEELENLSASLEQSSSAASAQLQVAVADAAMWRTRAGELETDKSSLEQSGSEASAQLQVAIADAAMWRTRAEELETDKTNLEQSGSEASAQLQVAVADAAMWRTKAEEVVEAPTVMAALAPAALLSGPSAEEAAATRELDTLNLKYDALRSELNKVNEDRARLGHELAEARSAHQADVEEVRLLVPALKAQLDAATKRMAVLQADLDDDDEERDALMAQIGKLRAAVDARPAPAAVALAASAPAGLIAATPPAENPAGTAPAAKPPEAKKAREPKAKADGGKTYVESCPQHLSDVKGIGTVFEGRLYAAGIGTYWELANTTKDALVKTLQLTNLQKERFDHAAIAADALRLAKETSSEGRAWDSRQPDDFEPIEGLGFTYEKRLYDAGVCTYAALIEASDGRLEEICRPGKIRKPDYASWRAQARQLMAKT
jgi:chromosome segregation ATPase/predicted flap endonuclease-1-like 5' DNA nuclease